MTHHLANYVNMHHSAAAAAAQAAGEKMINLCVCHQSAVRSRHKHVTYQLLIVRSVEHISVLSPVRIIICPIAIAYSMGQIIKSVCVCVCVCLSVCLSVCEHSHGRISWSIFTKIGTDVRTPKSKNEFVGGQYRTTPSPILLPPPKKTHFRPRGPENPCKY